MLAIGILESAPEGEDKTVGTEGGGIGREKDAGGDERGADGPDVRSESTTTASEAERWEKKTYPTPTPFNSAVA